MHCYNAAMLLLAVAMDALSSSLLFCATLSILSPVLRTLTKSYADDTIAVLASLLAFLHIVSHDYNYVNSGIGRCVQLFCSTAASATAAVIECKFAT